MSRALIGHQPQQQFTGHIGITAVGQPARHLHIADGLHIRILLQERPERQQRPLHGLPGLLHQGPGFRPPHLHIPTQRPHRLGRTIADPGIFNIAFAGAPAIGGEPAEPPAVLRLHAQQELHQPTHLSDVACIPGKLVPAQIHQQRPSGVVDAADAVRSGTGRLALPVGSVVHVIDRFAVRPCKRPAQAIEIIKVYQPKIRGLWRITAARQRHRHHPGGYHPESVNSIHGPISRLPGSTFSRQSLHASLALQTRFWDPDRYRPSAQRRRAHPECGRHFSATIPSEDR